MNKHLNDIVKYAHETGFFENILTVVREDGEALFTGMSKDGVVHLKANYKTPLTELSGNEKGNKIGMTRLDVLSAFLRSGAFSSSDDEKNSPTFTVEKRNDDVPNGIRLKSAYGHVGFYRFMSQQATKLRITMTKSRAEITDEDISFQPTETFLRDFQSFASVLRKFNSQFSLEVDKDGILYMNLGEDDTARIPVHNVGKEKSINPTYTWSIDNLLKVLKLANNLDNVTLSVSEEFGMIEVVIDDDNVTATYRLLHS